MSFSLRYKIYYFVFLIFQIGCQNNNQFERAKQLKLYLQNECFYEYCNQKSIVFLIVGGCDPCNEETLKLLTNFSKSKTFYLFPKLVILKSTNSIYAPILRNIGYKVFIDKEFKISRYGLDLSNNVVLKLSDCDHIDSYKFIVSNTSNEVFSYLSQQ